MKVETRLTVLDLAAIADFSDRSVLSSLPVEVLNLLSETLATANPEQAVPLLCALEETGWSEAMLNRVLLTLRRQFDAKLLRVMRQALPFAPQAKRLRKLLTQATE